MLTERTYDSAVFKVFLNIVTFLPFKIVKNMSSQIANQIKIKLCLVSNQLFIKQQQLSLLLFLCLHPLYNIQTGILIKSIYIYLNTIF